MALEVSMFRVAGIVLVSLMLIVAVACDDEECPSCPQTGPILHLTTHKLDFGASGTTAFFTIINKGEQALSWDLSVGDAAWLELSALSGSNEANITVTADRAELTGLGVHRAVITITCNAINTTQYSIEVFLLNGGRWLLSDDGEIDTCRTVFDYDYYWVKGFALPSGTGTAFIDSVSVYFCDTGTVRVLAFGASFSSELDLWFPSNAFFADNFLYLVSEGWNTIPVKTLLTQSQFYIGYEQIGANNPRLGLDLDMTDDSLGSRRAYDPPELPGDTLFWEQDASLETFMIRCFVNPVLEYNPKLHDSYTDEGPRGRLPELPQGLIGDGRSARPVR
jgi:hypothetical protein